MHTQWRQIKYCKKMMRKVCYFVKYMLKFKTSGISMQYFLLYMRPGDIFALF